MHKLIKTLKTKMTLNRMSSITLNARPVLYYDWWIDRAMGSAKAEKRKLTT